MSRPANIRYRPALFFGLALVIPWALWFAAAYVSRLPPTVWQMDVQTALGLAGLVAPVLLAAGLILPNPQLRADARRRLRLDAGRRYWLAAALLLPGLLVAAQLISVPFGHSLSQFHVSGRPSFSSAMLSPWFILVFAAVVEELAWHTYGTDALLSRFSLFSASLLFAVYWTLWHLPLAFIRGYYHSEVVAEGWPYALNFVFSLLLFVLLTNWLYAKSGRNILIAVLFHLSANVGNEVFATHPDSKIIQTALLLPIVLWLVLRDKKLFFGRGGVV